MRSRRHWKDDVHQNETLNIQTKQQSMEFMIFSIEIYAKLNIESTKIYSIQKSMFLRINFLGHWAEN